MNTVKKDRRVFRKERVKGARAWLAVALGTAGGAGFAPWAPGTFGSLVGLPLAYFTSFWTLPARALFWVALTIAGTWACTVFDELMETGDNQNLVIDEVVGVAITAASIAPGALGANAGAWIAAFVLFRLFDITKLPPVRQLDRLSHIGTSRWARGFGVMADDILAGFQGLLVMLLLQWRGII